MAKGLNIYALLIALFAISCSSDKNDAFGVESEHSSEVNSNDSLAQYVQDHTADTSLLPTPSFGYPFIESYGDDISVEDVASYLLKRLKDKNWLAISALTHEDLPVHISPKVHLDSNTFSLNGKLFSKLELTKEMITWYEVMASGDPLELNFEDYWNQYVWNKDYTKASLSFNKIENRSSIENNLESYFPDAEFIEAHLKGDQELSWQSLILVLKKYENKYYLIGLIHDQHDI
jgi:hypothetical protein